MLCPKCRGSVQQIHAGVIIQFMLSPVACAHEHTEPVQIPAIYCAKCKIVSLLIQAPNTYKERKRNY